MKENIAHNIIILLVSSQILQTLCFNNRNLTKNLLDPIDVGAIKDVMKDGLAMFGIPPMDPLIIKENIKVDNHYFKLELKLNAVFSNFSDFELGALQITPDLNVFLDMTFNRLQLYGRYEINGLAMEVVPLQGHGNINFLLENFKNTLKTKINPNDGVVQLKPFHYEYSVDTADFKLTGFLEKYNLDHIIKDCIYETLSMMLIKMNGFIAKYVDQATMKFGNNYLKQVNLQYIIEVIKEIAYPNY